MTRNLVRSLQLLIAPIVLWAASLSPACAQDLFNGWGAGCNTCSVGTFCQTHHCPPPLSHCQEQPPVIRVKCGCPRPICNPCAQPGWGYYEPCWSPWPFPPSYNHCLTLPPAATVALSGPNNAVAPNYGQGGPGRGAEPMLPSPRPLPAPVAPSMPPVTAPPVPTTPAMPRVAPNPMTGSSALPQGPQQPLGFDGLPFPRMEVPPQAPMPRNPNYPAGMY